MPGNRAYSNRNPASPNAHLHARADADTRRANRHADTNRHAHADAGARLDPGAGDAGFRIRYVLYGGTRFRHRN